MTDILSDYYDKFISYTGHFSSLSSDRVHSKRNNNLTSYGIKLSDNNILSFSPREFSKTYYKKLKSFYNSDSNINSNINSNMLIELSTGKLSKFTPTKINLKSSKNNNKKYKTMENFKNLYNKKSFSETDFTVNEKKSSKKSRNPLLIDDFSISNTKKTLIIPFDQYISVSPTSFHSINKKYVNSEKKNKKKISNQLKKENKELKNLNQAEKIVNDLLKMKSEKEIINYFKNKNSKLKTNYKLFSIYQEKKNNNFSGVESSVINPLEYIKYNLSKNPNNPEKYKTFKNQVHILGGEKKRLTFLDSIDIYKTSLTKYAILKGAKPCSLRKNIKNDKLKTRKIYNMICNNTNKRFHFDKDSTLRTKNNLNKKRAESILSLIDEDYQKFQKLLYNMEQNKKGEMLDYESNQEFIKKNKKFFSFDEKLNNATIRSQRTANYLMSRAKGRAQIRKAIDKLYEDYKI